MSPEEKEAWGIHAMGLELYYQRNFRKAAGCFARVRDILIGDEAAGRFLDRCRLNINNPPDADWTGIRIIEEKERLFSTPERAPIFKVIGRGCP